MKYTYQEEYTWLGFTARQRIFDLLNQVLKDKTLSLSMFAYDLNEPDILQILLQLAKQGRVRIILDDAALHHSTTKPTSEDNFTDLFNKAATKGAAIMRGHFGRYAHDKIFIVANKTGAIQVLTGSTNFSVTGMYVNSNHVLVFSSFRLPISCMPGSSSILKAVHRQKDVEGVSKQVDATSDRSLQGSRKTQAILSTSSSSRRLASRINASRIRNSDLGRRSIQGFRNETKLLDHAGSLVCGNS